MEVTRVYRRRGGDAGYERKCCHRLGRKCSYGEASGVTDEGCVA